MSSATVTSKAGPGLTVTAIVLNNVNEVDFQQARNVIQISGDGYRADFDAYSTATITYTVASRVYTLTVAQ